MKLHQLIELTRALLGGRLSRVPNIDCIAYTEIECERHIVVHVSERGVIATALRQ